MPFTDTVRKSTPFICLIKVVCMIWFEIAKHWGQPPKYLYIINVILTSIIILLTLFIPISWISTAKEHFSVMIVTLIVLVIYLGLMNKDYDETYNN